MWICSTIGFFSIVRKAGLYHIRARRREDLENLIGAINPVGTRRVPSNWIEMWRDADYRWRIRISSSEILDAVFAALQGTVHYPNFKDAILSSVSQREKLTAYSRLWADLQRLQK